MAQSAFKSAGASFAMIVFALSAPFVGNTGDCLGGVKKSVVRAAGSSAQGGDVPFAQAQTKTGDKDAGYLSKDCIDSLVQTAFVSFNTEFNEDEVMPEVMVRKHREVILFAKTVAQRLRKMAERDANRQYILWKVGELEEQIWLEEKGLMLKEQNRRQKMVNDLVDQFNAETGKPRPDFVALGEILKRMEPLDQRKFDELGQLINVRNRNIAREVLYSIEKALAAGELAKARAELDYCDMNKGMLQAPEARVRQLDSMAQRRMSVADERRLLEADVKNLARLFSLNRLGNGWRIAMNIRSRLESLQRTLPPEEIAGVNRRIDSLLQLAGAKEDSLVQYNLGLLRSAGIDSAMNFMEFTLPRIGVKSEKIGIVDMAILQAVRLRSGEEYSPVSKEFSGLPDSAANGDALLDGMMAAARKKSQIRQDSIRAVDEIRMRKARERMAREDKERRIQDEKAQRKAREEEKKRLVQQEKARQDSLKQTEAAITETMKAQQCMTDIYMLIEKNQVKDAYSRFLRSREVLKKYVLKDAYEALENTVIDSYSGASR